MILDQNQYSSVSGSSNEGSNRTGLSDGPRGFGLGRSNEGSSAAADPSNANLDSLIGGSIRILNSCGYPKQINSKNANRTKPSKPSFKQTQSPKSSSYQNSLSMKNITDIPCKQDFSLDHYNNLQLALRAATAALHKSKITASSNYIPLENASKKDLTAHATKCSKSPSESSTSSNQVLSGSANSALLTSNQSVFQPYHKLKQNKQKSNQTLNLTAKSKLYRNTLVIDTAQTEPANNSNVSSANTNTVSNSTSSALSSSSLSNQKLDTSDYDNIDNDVDSSKFKKISIQINPLKRHKSASTDVLNSSAKTSNDIDEDSLNNYNHIKADFDTIFNNLDKEISNIHSASPQPPKIQPYSGVLSKSLFSLVLKPQPVKPVREHPTKTEAAKHAASTRSLMKKKCVSTNNLLIESAKRCDLTELRVENTNSSKSVTTLNSKNDADSSDNSVDIDDVDCDYESNQADGDLYVDDFSEKDRKIRSLEAELRNKEDTIIELKKKLATEMEKSKYNQRKVCREQSESEKLAYEHKLNELKAHFSQQLSLFEENERLQMQSKLTSLQKIYNDLKMNYKKNLDSELKTLRSKLSESEANGEKLLKQLQTCQKATNSSSTQTSSANERDLANNNEIIYFLRKLKSENNELRLQIESERRRFQNEKEKWFMQLQSLKRNSVSSNENLTNSQSQTIVKKNHAARNQNGNIVNYINNSNQTNSEHTKSKSSQASAKQQSFAKNHFVNHQHYL